MQLDLASLSQIVDLCKPPRAQNFFFGEERKGQDTLPTTTNYVNVEGLACLEKSD
jgi:hypothetical protein